MTTTAGGNEIGQLFGNIPPSPTGGNGSLARSAHVGPGDRFTTTVPARDGSHLRGAPLSAIPLSTLATGQWNYNPSSPGPH